MRSPSVEAGVLGHHLAVPQAHHRRAPVPVVLPVEHENDLAPGGLSRQPDDLRIRLSRGERELPLRQPVSRGQVLGKWGRVLAGKQELVAEAHPSGYRLDYWIRRMST